MRAISLHGQWLLTSTKHPHLALPISIPGDVHSALIAAGELIDPYWSENERHAQWVHEAEWQMLRHFTVSNEHLSCDAMDLIIEQLDTFVTIEINDVFVHQATHQFIQHRFDVLPYLHEGPNAIRLIFHRVDEKAKKRAEDLPFPIPWAVGNNQIPHMNTIRKTQCHAGWDWGICLPVMGVYDAISLQPIRKMRLRGCETEQVWSGDDCQLVVRLDVDNDLDVSAFAQHSLSGVICRLRSPNGDVYQPSISSQEERGFIFNLTSPDRWWPSGYGEQYLYQLTVEYGEQRIKKQIGFRELRLDTTPDEFGSAMTFFVNGKPIMAKGANWIPVDALPSRQTEDRYRFLLESAKSANMNMIRVWGGGMYEKSVFYTLCDQLGLLVWQDFMFACALYPSTKDFIDEVSVEVSYQVKRLKDHPCIALWCGDNEVIGAINWYPESKDDRTKYVVNYDRLNREIHKIVEQLDPQRQFWASSPSNGELDFGDAWHDDGKGDLHFWDVWHSGKSFDAYRSVTPRFCSEFGYQSWPSLPTVKTFSPASDWNITSRSFEQHQKNSRGNSIITEMFTRYFRFPVGFEQMLYLSQVQQAIAIKTAVEYWRANKPRCQGILYWQLNDCWPVSSWSSIEYSGRWKQLHYHAKRFYAPQSAVFIEDENYLHVHLLNDAHTATEMSGDIVWYNWSGKCEQRWHITETTGADQHHIAWSLPLTWLENKEDQGFFHLELLCQGENIENTWFTDVYKRLPLAPANIKLDVYEKNGEVYIDCSSDKAAFYVHLETDELGYFSESSFTLLPDKKKTIRFSAPISVEALKANLCCYQLAQ